MTLTLALILAMSLLKPKPKPPVPPTPIPDPVQVGCLDAMVRTVDGLPSADQAVDIGDKRGITDGTGKVRILGIPPGTYTASAGRRGYVPALTWDVVIAASGCTQKTFIVERRLDWKLSGGPFEP